MKTNMLLIMAIENWRALNHVATVELAEWPEPETVDYGASDYTVDVACPYATEYTIPAEPRLDAWEAW